MILAAIFEQKGDLVIAKRLYNEVLKQATDKYVITGAKPALQNIQKSSQASTRGVYSNSVAFNALKMSYDRGGKKDAVALAMNWIQKGNIPEARKWIRKVVKDGTTEDLFDLGFVLERNKYLTYAEVLYRQVVKQGSEDYQEKAQVRLGAVRKEISLLNTYVKIALSTTDDTFDADALDLLEQAPDLVAEYKDDIPKLEGVVKKLYLTPLFKDSEYEVDAIGQNKDHIHKDEL